MIQIKILTANIALGVSTKGLWGLRAIVAFHGWQSIPYLLLRGNTLGGLLSYEAPPHNNRVQFFAKYSTLDRALSLVKKCNPDVAVLNEVLVQIHKEQLEHTLKQYGYAHIVWGLAKDYEDVTIATVIASKLPCEHFVPDVRQLHRISGGAGVVGVRLTDVPISIVGGHLTYGKCELSAEQIEDLARLVCTEKEKGRDTIIAGDFNERAKNILNIHAFQKLHLQSVTKQPTCPLNFPAFLRADLDHIFIPSDWPSKGTEYVNFGSDHLAVCTTVQVSERAG